MLPQELGREHLQLSHHSGFHSKISICRGGLWQPDSHVQFILLILSNISSSWRQKTLSWNWLVVSMRSNCCAHFALKKHISSCFEKLMHWWEGAEWSMSCCLWMHDGCIIDSHPEWLSGSPDTELGYIILLQWSMHHQNVQSCKMVYSNTLDNNGHMIKPLELGRNEKKLADHSSEAISASPKDSRYKIHLQVS